jgi:nitroimidazol reductase NimA-like FMN-containing flavoprotein (pyridoxamine 5'-phosphate oxidase superfamily)
MPGRRPRSARPYLAADARPEISWSELLDRLGDSTTYWLATTRDGRPHVMPLLAVRVDEGMYFCAGPSSRKARNLARNRNCVLATAAGGVDVVVEGKAARVSEPSTLVRAAAVYKAKYGWHAEPRGNAFYGAGAPTAGPPPLHLYELIPERVYGFGTDESLNAMRWSFGGK